MTRGEPARLWIASEPWAFVRIDGREVGRTTINGLRLAPGAHVLELRNEAAGLRRRLNITLRPGQQRRFSIDLANP